MKKSFGKNNNERECIMDMCLKDNVNVCSKQKPSEEERQCDSSLSLSISIVSSFKVTSEVLYLVPYTCQRGILELDFDQMPKWMCPRERGRGA